MSTSSYTNIACNVLYGRADSKKLAKHKVYKELLNACRYGKIDLLQRVLDKHKAEPFESVDVLIGELQLHIVENYELMKKSMKMRVPKLDLETVIEKCEVNIEDISHKN